MIADILHWLTVLEWALLFVLFLALGLVVLALGENPDRQIRSRPMPLPNFHPEPAPERPLGHVARHAEEGETRRLPRGVAAAPGSFHPRDGWEWLGSAETSGWRIWGEDDQN